MDRFRIFPSAFVELVNICYYFNIFVYNYRCVEATGSIFVNGHPRNTVQFHKMSRYIMQEDMLQPHLSVYEAMVIAADLKLGSELTTEQKTTVVSFT